MVYMQLNQALTQAEKMFNIAGGIPLVACTSGALRITAGKAQVTFAVIIGFIALVGYLASRSEELKNLGHRSLEQIKHGFLNIFRGTGEALLAITIVGPLVLLALQARKENGFEPRFKYNVTIEPSLVLVK